MLGILLTILWLPLYAQDMWVKSPTIEGIARVKNCVDFYLCSSYKEELEKVGEDYKWTVRFKEHQSDIQLAFKDCSTGNVVFETNFKNVARTTPSEEVFRNLLPMNLFDRTFDGFKKKESAIKDHLLKKETLSAMKSAIFEMEYPLEEYKLVPMKITRPNVLATTDSNLKQIEYDVDKWDGTLCRFYQIMRHEVQHVRNRRRIDSCQKSHHFRVSNHNERTTYMNDLVFIQKYCPENVGLSASVERLLFQMYRNPDLNPCDGETFEDTPEGKRANSPEKRYRYYRPKSFPRRDPLLH